MGCAGRIENAQAAVYLTYATRAGHAPIDRALYLPQSRAGDQERRAAAGVPAGVEFATRPELARQMIVRALDGGAAAPWVAGDEVCGADPGLRRELEARGTGYVLAVACSHRVTTAAGPAARFTTCSTSSPVALTTTSSTGCTGQHGGDGTSTAPGPATTKSAPEHEDHEVRLPY